MTKRLTVKERREARLWDDIRENYGQLLHWFYEQENRVRARPFAARLERLLKKVSPHHETVLGEECWSLIYELKGNYPEAIKYRENEIRLIERLQQLAVGRPNGHIVLRRYDYADLADRLELLAVLYNHAGALDKAVSVLQECERVCERNKIAFDAQELLESYLAEIAERRAKAAKRKKARRPQRRRKQPAKA
jgi:tetratricopeptide (TPR) repeat protein